MHKTLILCLTSVFVVISLTAEATIINIPGDYPTIQEGIVGSLPSDTVLVAEGLYYERLDFIGKDILLSSEFMLDNDTAHIQNTIIDADTSVLGISDYGSIVLFAAGEDSNSVIQGFTLQNGIGTLRDEYVRYGGAIFCINSSSPRIAHNIIRENMAQAGAGIGILLNSNPIIEQNIITANSKHGIYIRASDPKILSNTISNNTGEYGSGIFVNYDSDVIISGNIIRDNFGGLCGGGIYCQSAIGEINHNTIFGNEVVDWGGGICCDNANPEIVNNVISGNTAQSRGGGVFCLNDANPIIKNTIIWGNSAPNVAVRSGGNPTITFSAISNGWEGMGNISTDPLFVSAYEYDFNVCSQSPCIDEGDPGIMDPDGSCSDIGLYYHDHPNCDIGKCSYISTYGNDTTGIGTPQNPYRTIQHGIDVSFSSDTVLVETGTYPENIYVNAKNILLTSNYLYSGDTLDIYNTIIDGGGDSTVAVFSVCDNDAAIKGFTIRNGFGWFSGGIFSRYSDLTIADNIIEGNISDATGGGIYCEYGHTLISNNYIHNNTAESGGGIRTYYPESLNINNNKIIGNSAQKGGGLYASNLGFASAISNNLFSGNIASINGGGILSFGAACPIINNTFYGNKASTGGAVYCQFSNAEITNTIFWADSAISEAPEIYADNNSSPNLTYCDIHGGWQGEGNIDSNPWFRGPYIGDYYLMSIDYGFPYESPCIDAGHPDILDSVLDSLWGLGTILSDMGAYGGGDSVEVGIVNREIEVPKRLSLFQNYPNPFNAVTTIGFTLPQAQHVTLKVYDLLGRETAILIDEDKQAGEHAIAWKAGEISSGLYFYRIQTGDYKETQSMILLK